MGKVWENLAKFPRSNVKAEQHIGQNVYAPSAFSITCESSNADAKPNKPGFGMKYDDNKDCAQQESCKLHNLLLDSHFAVQTALKLWVMAAVNK